jgi:predicted DNA-binding antitoxin AbrB/MazE fold protein
MTDSRAETPERFRRSGRLRYNSPGGIETMSKTIRAVFKDGVFRPTEHVELPEQTLVEFEPRPVGSPEDQTGLDAIYEVLSRRRQSGRHDLAERHDEPQP